MSHVQELNGTAKKPPTLSGPHICSHVGNTVFSIAKSALAASANMNGGSLSAAEIENTLDLVSSAPDLFSLYTQQFATCAGIHKTQKFTPIDPEIFARFILQSYCHDVVRIVFEDQIRRAGPAWVQHFMGGQIAHISAVSNADFVEQIYARYRTLAMAKGTDLDTQLLYNDVKLQALVGNGFAVLNAETDEHAAFADAINSTLGTTLNAVGPSPLKVTNGNMACYLETLRQAGGASYFRRCVQTLMRNARNKSKAAQSVPA